MRIALVSTVYRPTPPLGYGGIERVVHEYACELVRQGHEVTLFACEGSKSPGRLVEIPAPKRNLTGVNRADELQSEEPLYEAMKAEFAINPVDLIHDWSFENLYVLRHPEAVPFLISSCIPVANDFVRPNLVAAGKVHGEALGGGIPYVHYGLDLSVYPFVAKKTAPAVHMAKVAPYKAQHEAVLASLRSGVPLDVYGVPEHKLYYNGIVRPLIMLARGVRWCGETGDLPGVLGPARALIQTPRWMDALPLVVIQALACGTPVLAYPSGGLVEQVIPGETGFLVNSVSEMASAMKQIDTIDPAACRQFAEDRFSARQMVASYMDLAARVQDGEQWIGGPGKGLSAGSI